MERFVKMICKNCNGEYESNAIRCPFCGSENESEAEKRSRNDPWNSSFEMLTNQPLEVYRIYVDLSTYISGKQREVKLVFEK